MLLLCACGYDCFKSLMQRIPNADYVMNPCDPAQPWEGIGHFLPAGYGDRNQFGRDFKHSGLVCNFKFFNRWHLTHVYIHSLSML